MALGKGKHRSNRPIHVEPHPMAMAERSNSPKGVDRSPYGGARSGHHRNHRETQNLELLKPSLQELNLEASGSVDRDQLQRFRRQTHHRERFSQGDMGIGTGDHHRLRAALQTPGAAGRHQGHQIRQGSPAGGNAPAT